MLIIGTGALMIIGGVVLMATRTLARGRLSDATPPPASETPDTLEPKGRGRQLGLKADLPGLSLIVLGTLLVLAGAL